LPIYKRECPVCGKTIKYISRSGFWKAVALGEVCNLCYSNFICKDESIQDYEDWNKSYTEKQLMKHFSSITLKIT